jgi:hypothetical protein
LEEQGGCVVIDKTFVDTDSKWATAKLYITKAPLTTADLLNDLALPFREEQQMGVLKTLTGRGTESWRQHAHGSHASRKGRMIKISASVERLASQPTKTSVIIVKHGYRICGSTRFQAPAGIYKTEQHRSENEQC